MKEVVRPKGQMTVIKKTHKGVETKEVRLYVSWLLLLADACLQLGDNAMTTAPYSSSEERNDEEERESSDEDSDFDDENLFSNKGKEKYHEEEEKDDGAMTADGGNSKETAHNEGKQSDERRIEEGRAGNSAMNASAASDAVRKAIPAPPNPSPSLLKAALSTLSSVSVVANRSSSSSSSLTSSSSPSSSSSSTPAEAKERKISWGKGERLPIDAISDAEIDKVSN